MSGDFTAFDWAVFALYFIVLTTMGWHLSRRKIGNYRDYFLGGNTMPFWVVGVSVLATTQSAATFLGGPDQGFRGDLSYLSTNIGVLLAAIFVARVLIPRFYALKATTVYELLQARYDVRAMRGAGAMYLVGRAFASGVRLYMAALAVSMILYLNIEPVNVVLSAGLLVLIGFLFTFLGGIRSIIWSDVMQCTVYVGAAVAVLVHLWLKIPADGLEIIGALSGAGGGPDKLALFDFSLTFSSPFTIWATFTGIVLLNIAAYGLDQDMTQRVLTCKDSKSGGKAVYLSVLLVVPVMLVFMLIGSLLHVYYERPDLMAGAAGGVEATFSGEKITVFLHYILTEMPSGLRGLVVVGVIAAALSTLNSGLNSMSSVLVEDFYHPWRAKRGEASDGHYVWAGRVGMALVGALLFSVAVLCFYWQRYSDMPLLEFALSVMVFSYSGLLGVYFTAIFTKRGSSTSVLGALLVGFTATLAQQPYIVDALSLPASWGALAFPWQLCIGTGLAFAVCMAGRTKAGGFPD